MKTLFPIAFVILMLLCGSFCKKEETNSANDIFIFRYANLDGTKKTGATGEDLSFTLTDLTGRQLRADRPGGMADGLNAYLMDVTGVQPGIYFVTVSTAATETVTKVITIC